MLKVVGEGAKLKLVESGRPGYNPYYTNPKRLADMVVRIKSTGTVVSSCKNAEGAPTRCGSVPFFTKTLRTESSTIVKVVDIHGEDVGQQEFFDDEQELDEFEEQDDDEKACQCSGGGDGSGGGGGTDGEEGGGGGDGDWDSFPDEGGGDDGGGAVCDEADIIAKRDAFCADVNAYLAKQKMSPIDCSSLDDPIGDFDDDDIQPPNAQDESCEDIWEPHYKKVTKWLVDCDKSVKRRTTNWHEVVRYNLLSKGACDGSPIVLDLDGDGFSTTTPERGVRFDLLGHGPVQTAWITGNDAFLALDRDGNGRIDGARELFGNATRGARFADGFAALSELDDNGDGRIDEQDAVYGELLLWRDADRDGVSSPDELVTLQAAGIRALYLSTARVTGEQMFDANSNRIPLIAGFERADGTKGAMADIFLRFKP